MGFGRNRLGSGQGADVQTRTRQLLLLPAASDHLGRELLHAKQVILRQPGCHSAPRCYRNVLERGYRGHRAVGLLRRGRDG